jgi:hypothetical protein
MSQLTELPPPIGNLKQMIWTNDNIDRQAWDSRPVYVTQEAASWGIHVKTIKYINQMWDKQTSILAYTLGFYISSIDFNKKRAVCFAKSR